MAILQVYQADLLVKNFAKATELALHATKQTSCSIGHSMAALVIMERHLWLNLSAIWEEEKIWSICCHG